MSISLVFKFFLVQFVSKKKLQYLPFLRNPRVGGIYVYIRMEYRMTFKYSKFLTRGQLDHEN